MKRQRTRQVIAYAIATLLVLALTFTCVAACGSFDIGQGDKTELTDGTISSVDSAYTSKSSVYASSESLPSSDHHTLKSSFISHLSSDRETTKSSKSSKDDRTTAVSYTHLDVYKRQSGKLIEAFSWTSCLVGADRAPDSIGAVL